MGSSVSTELSQSIPLTQFASLQDLDVEDEKFWNELLRFSGVRLSSTLAHTDVGPIIDPLCAKLVRNNCKTRNFSKLVLQVVRRVNRVISLLQLCHSRDGKNDLKIRKEEEHSKEPTSGNTEKQSLESFNHRHDNQESISPLLVSNGLFLIRIFTRYFFENYGRTLVILQYCARPQPGQVRIVLGNSEGEGQTRNSSKSERRKLADEDVSGALVSALCSFLVHVQEPKYLYCEVLQTMLSLLSTVSWNRNSAPALNQHDIPLGYFAPWQTTSSNVMVNMDENAFAIDCTTADMFMGRIVHSRSCPNELFSRLLQCFARKSFNESTKATIEGYKGFQTDDSHSGKNDLDNWEAEKWQEIERNHSSKKNSTVQTHFRSSSTENGTYNPIKGIYTYFTDHGQSADRDSFGDHVLKGEDECVDDEMKNVVEQSLSLLLVLLSYSSADSERDNSYQWGQMSATNQFRRLLVFLQDTYVGPRSSAEERARETLRGEKQRNHRTQSWTGSPLVPLSYVELYYEIVHHLRKGPSSPSSHEAALLLYFLLADNISFKRFLLSRTDLDIMILPLLKKVYNFPMLDRTLRKGSSQNAGQSLDQRKWQLQLCSQFVYTILVILLIFAEDTGLNKLLPEIQLEEVNWYKEEYLKDITLQDLIVVTLCKVLQFITVTTCDTFIASTALGVILNMSPWFTQLSSPASYRLARLFEVSKAKYYKCQESLSQMKVYTEASVDVSEEKRIYSDANGVHTRGREDTAVSKKLTASLGDRAKQLRDESDLCITVMTTLLQAVNSLFRHSLPQNPYLIYCIVHEKHMFSNIPSGSIDPALKENLQLVINYFNAHLEGCTDEKLTSNQILGMIATACIDWKPAVLLPSKAVKARYAERGDSSSFHSVFIWNIVHAYDQFLGLNMFSTLLDGCQVGQRVFQMSL